MGGLLGEESACKKPISSSVSYCVYIVTIFCSKGSLVYLFNFITCRFVFNLEWDAGAKLFEYFEIYKNKFNSYQNGPGGI